jgi:hypothetical protein
MRKIAMKALFAQAVAKPIAVAVRIGEGHGWWPSLIKYNSAINEEETSDGIRN